MNLELSFQRFSDAEFHLEIQVMAKEERCLTLKMIHAIQEVESRLLHSKTGHSSLFDYCTRVLGYSETAALRRISAARLLLKASPALQSNRKTEEKLRVVSEEMTELKLPADSELMQLLEEAKALLACPQNMNPSMVQILKESLPLLIGKKKREKRGIKPIRTQNAPPAPAVTQTIKEVSTPSTRFIPVSLKRAVFDRAKGQCEYVSPITGECCTSQHALELHHRRNYSEGGSHSLENLRVFCHSHNIAKAKADFPWLKRIQ